MFRSIFKIVVITTLLFSFVKAQDNSTQNIVDIVDYRFNSIRQNINSDIDNVKIELEKIKQIQDETIEKDISNIDNSIQVLEKKLEKSISDTKAFEKEFQHGVDKYNEIVIRQDKRIEDINSNINLWAIVFLFVVFLIVMIAIFVIRIYTKKVKDEASKETNEILTRWKTQKKDHEDMIIQRETQLHHQIEYWQNKYKDSNTDDKKLFKEFKFWSKNIEDKKLKSKIKKYIKKFQKENKDKKL